MNARILMLLIGLLLATTLSSLSLADTKDENLEDEDVDYYASGDCKGETCAWRNKCGQRPKVKSSNMRIINGVPQMYGEWPWFVRLTRAYGYGHNCGGVLISDQHVLTARHCVSKIPLREIRIVAGDHYLNQEDKFEQWRKIESMCLPRNFGYEHNFETHDWVLLRLNERIKFNDYVQPICLPYEQANLDLSSCWLVASGLKFFMSPQLSTGSHNVEKMHVEMVSCKREFPKIQDNDETRTCWRRMGATGTSCFGDSGSPVMCPDTKLKRWVLVALVSAGHPYCSPIFNQITIYSSITKQLASMKDKCKI